MGVNALRRHLKLTASPCFQRDKKVPGVPAPRTIRERRLKLNIKEIIFLLAAVTQIIAFFERYNPLPVSVAFGIVAIVAIVA